MGEQEIDSQIKEMLDLLRPVPRRSPEALRRSRSRFYADLDVYFPVEASYSGSMKAPSFKPVGVSGRFNPLLRRPVFTYLAVLVFVFIALFGGGYITASAAGAALPGDALYPIKLDLEQARLSLTTNRVRQAELHLEFAERRMDEITALTALGQYEKVGSLAKQFNHQLSLALGAAQVLENLQPEDALQLRNAVSQALVRFEVATIQVVSNAPKTLRPGLEATFKQASKVNPPTDDNNANNGVGSGTSNGNPNPGNPNPGNPNPGNANDNANPLPGNNNANSNSNANANANANSNANSNSSGAPGQVITGNSNDHPAPDLNSNKDKTKDNNNNGKGKGKDNEKENNGKNK